MIIPYAGALSKWNEKKAANIKASTVLQQATLPHNRAATAESAAEYWLMRGEKMAECATKIIYNYCAECGSMHIAKTNLCRDRLCPLCSWRLALQRSGEMMATLNHLAESGLEIRAAMITLTIKNVRLDGLSEALEAILDAWSRLRKRTIWKKWVAGYARSIEITKGKKGTYHPHMHIFIIWRDGYHKNISQRELCNLWKESLRIDYIPVCDIRAAYCSDKALDPQSQEWSGLIKAAIEATKYALSGKVTLGIDKPNELAGLALAVKNRRLLAYGGVIAEARKELKFADDDSPTDVSEMTIECPKCGGNIVQFAFEWGISGYCMGLMPSVPTEYPVIDSVYYTE